MSRRSRIPLSSVSITSLAHHRYNKEVQLHRNNHIYYYCFAPTLSSSKLTGRKKCLSPKDFLLSSIFREQDIKGGASCRSALGIESTSDVEIDVSTDNPTFLRRLRCNFDFLGLNGGLLGSFEEAAVVPGDDRSEAFLLALTTSNFLIAAAVDIVSLLVVVGD